MKLKNKTTGEVRDWCIDKDKIRTCDSSIIYGSIAELCEEWSDYEEPKELYIVDARHECCVGILNIEENPEWCANLVELGLGFETKEEAEEAIEKLKAWCRLKDKILGHSVSYHYNDIAHKVLMELGVTINQYENMHKDLTLIFGDDIENVAAKIKPDENGN